MGIPGTCAAVTLSLIARIRELEEGLQELVDRLANTAGTAHARITEDEIVRSGAVELLEKGAVLP